MLKVGYTLVRNMRYMLCCISDLQKNSPCPETQNKMVSSSKVVKVMVCGLDHSGSQPFIYNIYSVRTCI